MRKLMLLGAVLAISLVALAPAAVAQTVQEIMQTDADSGEIGQGFDVSSDDGTEDPTLQEAAPPPEEAPPPPEEAPPPAPAAAPPPPAAAPPPPPAPAAAPPPPVAPPPPPPAEAKAGGTEAKAQAPKMEAMKAQLPKTGGSGVSLFALGGGILLVAGGLLARRALR